MSGKQYLTLVSESDSVECYAWLLAEQAAGTESEPVAMSEVMVMSTAGLTFNASTQTITGYTNQGTISVQVLEYGLAVQQPADPTRSGYTFTGWTPVFSSTATSDVTYTATYVEREGISINLMDHNSELVGTYAMEVRRSSSNLLASLFGSSNGSTGSSTSGSSLGGDTFVLPSMDMSDAEIITPGIGDINIDGATITTGGESILKKIK